MHLVRWIFLLLPFVATLVGCRESSRPVSTEAKSTEEMTIAKIAASYSTYRKITPHPVLVNPGLARLCRGAFKSDVERLRAEFGPHAHTEILIYMNDSAAQAFASDQQSYPPGSVIVKQKTLLDYYDETTKKRVRRHPAGVGGMVKRAPGFDAEHGDWEYFYFEDPEKIESGKIASCVDCHQNAKARDYVYGTWGKMSSRVK